MPTSTAPIKPGALTVGLVYQPDPGAAILPRLGRRWLSALRCSVRHQRDNADLGHRDHQPGWALGGDCAVMLVSNRGVPSRTDQRETTDPLQLTSASTRRRTALTNGTLQQPAQRQVAEFLAVYAYRTEIAGSNNARPTAWRVKCQPDPTQQCQPVAGGAFI
jgi:hypothetical protein